MDNLPDFELPTDSEKLSSRFILESVRKRCSQPTPDSASPAMEPPNEEFEEVEECSPPDEGETQFELTNDPVEQCGTEAPNQALEETQEELNIPLIPLDLPPGKKYFRVSEVSELIGVEGYVLRYWQSEFATVRPFKSSSGHWVYSRKDVEALHLIRHLLHTEKYSIKGAKQRLREKRGNKPASLEQDQKTLELLKSLARELKDLAELARTDPGSQ